MFTFAVSLNLHICTGLALKFLRGRKVLPFFQRLVQNELISLPRKKMGTLIFGNFANLAPSLNQKALKPDRVLTTNCCNGKRSQK